MSGSISSPTTSQTPFDLPAALISAIPVTVGSASSEFPSGAPAWTTPLAGTGDTGATTTSATTTPRAVTGGFLSQLSSAVQSLLVQFQATGTTTTPAPASTSATSTASTSSSAAGNDATTTTTDGTTSTGPVSPITTLLNFFKELEASLTSTTSAATATAGTTGGTTTDTASTTAETVGTTSATGSDVSGSLVSTVFHDLAHLAAQAVQAYTASGSLTTGAGGTAASFA